MRTSRSGGDDAITRTTSGVGLDDTKDVSSHQHQSVVVKEQRAFFAAHLPSRRTVSDERIAPIRCTRPATLPIFNYILPAQALVSVPCPAGPPAAKLMGVRRMENDGSS